MRNRVRVTAAMLSLVATAGAVAACGSSSPSHTASASSAAPGQGGFQAYTACLAQHGVTLPSRGARPSGRPSVRPSARPSGGFGGRFAGGNEPPAGVDAATWQKAQEACASLRPSGGPGGAGRNNSAFAAYRNCLSDHGVTMSAGPNGLDASDPKVAEAMKVCAPLRPSTRPTPSPST